MGQVAGIRRTGAAAIDLAWVAAGRFDGYAEHNLGAWDMAAGTLLVREAGGHVTDVDGGHEYARDRQHRSRQCSNPQGVAGGAGRAAGTRARGLPEPQLRLGRRKVAGF